MTRYIALLRGINLGGKRKILMADLKQLFNNLQYFDVTTYIQTGNVIFNANHKEDSVKIADKIGRSISSEYGFEVPVIIRTADELNELISKNPFFGKGDIDIERLHLTLLKNIPDSEALEHIKTYDFAPDKFKIIGKSVFIYCSKQYRDTKLGNNFFENKLKVKATTRNWKTVLKLSELSDSHK